MACSSLFSWRNAKLPFSNPSEVKLLPFFSPLTTVFQPLGRIEGFIKGEVIAYFMPSKRRKAQAYTRQVRAIIKSFLRGMEFAPKKEIFQHIRCDDSLPLTPSERVSVAHSVLRKPVFDSFTTVNVVGDRVQTLWRVNESYEEFQPFKKD